MDELMTAAVLLRHGGLDAIEIHNDWPMPVAGDDELLVQV